MKKLGILAVCLIILGALALFVGRWWGLNYLQQPLANNNADAYLLNVERGVSARQVVQKINEHFSREQQAVDYRLAQWLVGVDHIQQGLYEIEPEQSWFAVWQMLKNGEEKTFSVTLIEGHTIEQWLQRLQQAEYLRTTLDTTDPKALVEQLSFVKGYSSIEGLLLPETYQYRAHQTDIDILKRAYQAMQTTLNQVWQQRAADCPVDTPYELLILASIIEKETGVASERGLVASVFANRIAKGMRLQSDPTTIYGITDFDGNLTRKHLREKTAFNTYRIDGLPPTPIAMPSLASLQAAADPAESDYLYFVANKNGEHVFSKTLEAHNQAVRKYQLNQ